MNLRRMACGSTGAFLAIFGATGLVGCQQRSLADSAALPRTADSSYTADRFESRPVRVTVPVGTEVHLTLSSPIGSATSQVGDTVTGTTTVAILVSDQVAIPAGSTVYGRVTGVDPATKGLQVSDKGGAVALAFTSITTPRGDSASMSGSLTSVASSKGKTAGIIGGSAAGGAILGKILGGDTKDAAIGAVVGGGIGTGIAAGTKGKEVVIPAGTDLAITIDEPLTIAQRS
jgi:hypothetical protein